MTSVVMMKVSVITIPPSELKVVIDWCTI